MSRSWALTSFCLCHSWSCYEHTLKPLFVPSSGPNNETNMFKLRQTTELTGNVKSKISLTIRI